jgi:peptidyl-dipeptidase Dcp
MSPEQIGAAAEAAKARGLKGKWLITLQNTTTQPALEQITDRAMRERVYRASIARNNGGEFDNTALVAKIVKLRAKQAKLLGYSSYAAYLLEDQSAGTPEAVNKMLGQLGPAALLKAKNEAADIKKLMDAQAAAAGIKPFELQPWDWAFYAQQARKARFNFDDAQVKPYFEIERVIRDGAFHAAQMLYGITFKERTDLPVYHPDVRVYEVFNEDGSALGLLLRDDFKRDNKDGGAWAEFIVDQAGLFGQKPVLINSLNIPKPAAGQPALLTFDELETLFHELGHALHGLFSSVKYPLLAGFNVPADFSEYPSQINEMFTRDPATLANFAKHYKTGELMPQALQNTILSAQTYGAGFGTFEYVAAAMLDQSWHQIPEAEAPEAAAVTAFEEATLKKNGMDYGPIPPRYHTPYFAHAFCGGYQASYYAYIWSEVLARDSGEWMRRHGGFTRANGDLFRAKILQRGRTMEPGAMFEEFYGAAPEIGPLLEYRGLKLPKTETN